MNHTGHLALSISVSFLLLVMVLTVFTFSGQINHAPGDHCHLEDGSVVSMTCEEWMR